MRYNCPQCGQHLDIDEWWVGKATQCPTCQLTFLVPEPELSAVTRPWWRMRWAVAALLGGVLLGTVGVWLAVRSRSASPTDRAALAGTNVPSAHKPSTAPGQPAASAAAPGPESAPRNLPRPSHSGSINPPKLAVQTTWQFAEGSGGMVVSPNRWTTTLIIENADTRTWSLTPDLLMAEVVGTDALAGAVCPGANQEVRKRVMPFIVNGAPEGTNGSATTLILFPSDSGLFTLDIASFDAHWRLNGKESPWTPTRLKPGERLECTWEYLSPTAFKPEVRSKPGFHLFHLGPVLSCADDPRGPAFVLATHSVPATSDQWCGGEPEFVPLTSESVRRRVSDPSQPVAWRAQFLAMSWDQPRPVDHTDAFALETLNDAAGSPVDLRKTAAASLLERRYGPAKPTLVAIARNQDASVDLRLCVIRGLHRLGGQDILETLSGIARDIRQGRPAREAALNSLFDWGAEGHVVVRSLCSDAELGVAARTLLNPQSSPNH